MRSIKSSAWLNQLYRNVVHCKWFIFSALLNRRRQQTPWGSQKNGEDPSSSWAPCQRTAHQNHPSECRRREEDKSNCLDRIMLIFVHVIPKINYFFKGGGNSRCIETRIETKKGPGAYRQAESAHFPGRIAQSVAMLVICQTDLGFEPTRGI